MNQQDKQSELATVEEIGQNYCVIQSGEVIKSYNKLAEDYAKSMADDHALSINRKIWNR